MGSEAMQWADKRVIVTGGSGFLGSFVVEKLRERGCQNVIVPRSKDLDLRDRDAIVGLYKEVQPHIVIHLAAVVGGIGANRANPGRFFYDNAIMGIQLMEYARQFGVEKFVAVGTICAYPKFTPVLFKEDDLRRGYSKGIAGTIPCTRTVFQQSETRKVQQQAAISKRVLFLVES